METVILKPLQHRGKECIGIYFEKNVAIQSAIQKSVSAIWSKTNRCWYISLSKENYQQLANILKGKADLKNEELKKYLVGKKEGNDRSTFQDKPLRETIGKNNPVKKALPAQQRGLRHPVSKENKEALLKFQQTLALKSYSPSTIRTYTNEFVQFLQTIKEKPANEFTTARIKDYMQYCAEKLKLSENTLHSKINALKFYYEQVLGREKFFWEIPRPKKPHQLPKVLSENEIGRMFNKDHTTVIHGIRKVQDMISINLEISDHIFEIKKSILG